MEDNIASATKRVDNIIVSILKGVSYVVLAIGVIAFFVYGSDDEALIGFMVLLGSGLSALIYYAMGEVISLLQDIKDNTAQKSSLEPDGESLKNIRI